MLRKRPSRFIVPTLVVGLLNFTQPAQAVLGGSIASIGRDQTALKTQYAEVRRMERYSVHELKQAASNIREYASSDGKVFAVTWKGSTQPDLSKLLGKYYDQFKQGRQNAQRGKRFRARGPRVLKTRELVVEQGGHVRNIRGKAYLPEELPVGIKPEDLK